MASSLGQGCSESWMKSWGRRRGNPSQKLILAEMHPLDYVAAVVEHPSNILRVYCACKVWITVMFTISAGCADPLDETKENCYMKSKGRGVPSLYLTWYMPRGEGRGWRERKFLKWNIGVVSQAVNYSNG